MAEFQYQVITSEGKEKKGSIESKTKESAIAQLKADKNIVISIVEANIMNKDINLGIFTEKVKPRDFSIFCRQFVSIISAGVSVINALAMLSEQTTSKTLQKGIMAVHDDVSKGEALATAMRKHGKVFPEMLCNMVEAGEASGSLDIAFERMAVQFEKDNKMKESVKKAMIYPIVVLVVMFGVLIAMMVFVIPNFESMFAELGSELPVATQIVVNMSYFIRTKWWLLIFIIALIVFLYKMYAKSENGKYALAALRLKLPIFGILTQKSCCARLGRTLCTLLGAGVPLLDALEITARSMENVQYRRALLTAREQVGRGVNLSKPLKACGLFPPMVIHMISIGEETGNIEEMLENIANYYEDDVANTTEQLTALMEPMIIVVMALMVGLIVMAVMSPMLQLYQDLDTL